MAITRNDGYIGFSSKNYERNKSFRLTDIELVKEDLKNHIFTRKNERVKMATFGTRIPDLPFEQLDDITLEVVREDLTTVFNYDPRVQLISLRVIPLYNESAIVAIADLNFIYLNFSDQLDIRIDFQK